MNPWLLLLILLLVPTISESQTVCFEYASRVSPATALAATRRLLRSHQVKA
jgi:hypothetical protein